MIKPDITQPELDTIWAVAPEAVRTSPFIDWLLYLTQPPTVQEYLEFCAAVVAAPTAN